MYLRLQDSPGLETTLAGCRAQIALSPLCELTPTFLPIPASSFQCLLPLLDMSSCTCCLWPRHLVFSFHVPWAGSPIGLSAFTVRTLSTGLGTQMFIFFFFFIFWNNELFFLHGAISASALCPLPVPPTPPPSHTCSHPHWLPLEAPQTAPLLGWERRSRASQHRRVLWASAGGKGLDRLHSPVSGLIPTDEDQACSVQFPSHLSFHL